MRRPRGTQASGARSVSEAGERSKRKRPLAGVPGGAVRDRYAALLGTSSQARDPTTDDNNSAEGAAEEEDALVRHGESSIGGSMPASRVSRALAKAPTKVPLTDSPSDVLSHHL
jgi:hypothetical protein